MHVVSTINFLLSVVLAMLTNFNMFILIQFMAFFFLTSQLFRSVFVSKCSEIFFLVSLSFCYYFYFYSIVVRKFTPYDFNSFKFFEVCIMSYEQSIFIYISWAPENYILFLGWNLI